MECLGPRIGGLYYIAQLGLPEKGLALKELVVYRIFMYIKIKSSDVYRQLVSRKVELAVAYQDVYVSRLAAGEASVCRAAGCNCD